jgi:microcystin-dependent protein
MTPAFIGSIWLFGGSFQVVNFQYCNGQLISIAENSTLYALIGTIYGGDGVSTFALPDLRGRVAIGMGQGPGTSNYVIGQRSGVESVTLTTSQMPSHTHLVNAASGNASTGTPNNTLFLAAATTTAGAETLYSTAASNATMNNGTVGTGGGSVPFSVVQPILCGTYLMAMYGVFPSQN